MFSLDESIKCVPIEALSPEQSQKRVTNLQSSVLFNRVCLFGAKRLRDYQNSGISIVSYLLTILILFMYSIISFSIINYGLYKIDANLYNAISRPDYFTFFYYSFNKILFTSISEISAVMPISQIVSMIEQFVAFILISILISSLFAYKSKRAADEISKVISDIEREGENIEGFIRNEYNIDNISSAIAELERVKSGIVGFIYWLSKN
jgi:hypothetical protein